MFHYSFNALPRVTNALPYALPYYNTQFLKYSTDDLFLCNIRCITVHVTMHFEVNKVHICTIFNGLPRVTVNFIKKVIVYFFFKNLMVTRGNALKMVQILSCSIQNVWYHVQ